MPAPIRLVPHQNALEIHLQSFSVIFALCRFAVSAYSFNDKTQSDEKILAKSYLIQFSNTALQSFGVSAYSFNDKTQSDEKIPAKLSIYRCICLRPFALFRTKTHSKYICSLFRNPALQSFGVSAYALSCEKSHCRVGRGLAPAARCLNL